jgi:predicted RNase H-like nuclease (RuvC/YqgF family)
MTTDYVCGFEVETIGAIVPVFQENYKSIILELDCIISVCKVDIENTEEEIEKLAREWDYAVEKSRKFFFELNEKANHLSENIKEDEATIKKCENTINLIKTFAKIRGWE